MKSAGESILTINGGSSSIRFAVYETGETLRRRLDAPDHLPREIALIEAFLRRHPKLPQVACFDTAFHRTMPQVARLLPIPRRYAKKGVERYDFHGLSYAYLMEELARLGDPAATMGRVILAHLGNGASLTAAQFQQMVNHESGLLGVSGTSSDLRDLLAQETADVRAAQAVALFCYQAKEWIGSFATALGGLDTLVFAGGIGENAPLIRKRICDGLGFLGIELNQQRNAKNAPLISPDAGRVKVRVIRTDEERMIARSVMRVLKLGSIRET